MNKSRKLWKPVLSKRDVHPNTLNYRKIAEQIEYLENQIKCLRELMRLKPSVSKNTRLKIGSCMVSLSRFNRLIGGVE